MSSSDAKRLSRLNAIVLQLQTKRLITSTELSKKYGVSVRTIYRDMRAIEASGVPIITEDGKGYSLMEGYRIPPVMFSENEANALVLAEQLVLQNQDASFVNAYREAIDKIKAVLGHAQKDKANLLTARTRVNFKQGHKSNNLSSIQYALTNFRLLKIDYSNADGGQTSRMIEPFALLSTSENWLLLAWCRLRKEFRYFRIDRIENLQVSEQTFEAHKITLEEFLIKTKNSCEPLT